MDAAPTRKQRCPLRVAASDTGATPLASRPCFPGVYMLLEEWSIYSMHEIPSYM